MVYGEKKYPVPKSYRDEILGLISYDPYILMLKVFKTDNLKLMKNVKLDENV